MTNELPPLPPPDLGSIMVGREEICMGHSDDAMRAYAIAAIAAEREACAKLCDDMDAAAGNRHNYFGVAARAIRARATWL